MVTMKLVDSLPFVLLAGQGSIQNRSSKKRLRAKIIFLFLACLVTPALAEVISFQVM